MTKHPELSGVELQALNRKAVALLATLELDLRQALDIASSDAGLAERAKALSAAFAAYKSDAKDFIDMSGRIEKYREIIGDNRTELDLASAEDEILARAARLGQSG